jgi:hypothetical protein
MRRQRYELILEHPNIQRRKIISRTDPVISASKFITSQVEKGTLFEENKAISASPACALAF